MRYLQIAFHLASRRSGDIFRFWFVFCCIFFATGIVPCRQKGVKPYHAVFLTHGEQLVFSGSEYSRILAPPVVAVRLY